VGSEPLRVDVVIDKPAVDLEDDQTGRVPQDVAVTVTNTLAEPIANVTLEPLDLRSRRLPAPVPASLVVEAGPFVPGPAPQPMCLAFPRPGKFVAEKQLVRVTAAQAPGCPAE
jgi:hypothetical protein